MAKLPSIISVRMPRYFTSQSEWAKWRLCYEGGIGFRDTYLKKFNSREQDPDFLVRKEVTPIPTFAKAAISDIRNAIFQRMTDIIRRGGGESYQKAIEGFPLGVDRRGSTMNAFVGQKVLEELLVMGKVGVYVDAPQVVGDTLADVGAYQPYLYSYAVEDILSFSCNTRENLSEFKSLLLRDETLSYNAFDLPDKIETRFRHLWIDEEGFVKLQFYNQHGEPVDQSGNPAGPVPLQLRRIPFVLMDIGDSLMKDVCEYQIALLNLASSDVNYALKANFPFYTEMRDNRDVGAHLKKSNTGDGNEIKTGVTQGRYYDKDMERPAFIHPSPEPLKASMDLQDKFEKDIRKLVNLAVQTLATRQSAEAKSLDNQGLESGLAFIGLVLETGERQIASHWAAYEGNREIPTIKYPEQYSLKGEAERIEEATDLSIVITKTPSKTARKELWKTVCRSLLGGKISPDKLLGIYKEIDDAKFTTSDPEIIIQAKEAGLVGDEIGSIALGFPDGEYLQARKDHVDRLERIAKAQGITQSDSDPASRGVTDLSANPKAGSEEKKESRDRTFDADNKDRTRGRGK